MSTTATVVDGVITNNSTSTTSTTTTSSTAGGTLDKNAFLQLLVAQMKYQDPLEPTDNTEYVSQLATFTELEEMQNLSSTSEKQSAAALVGKYVSINDTDTTGNTKTVEGYVDSVVYSGSNTYLQVNDSLYNYDDLDTVYDDEYLAYQAAAAAATTTE